MAFHIVKRPVIQQQIQQPYQNETLLQGIGRGFGTGLTDVLNSLADAKINQIKDQYGYNPASDRLQRLGIPRNQADFIAQLSPAEQLSVVSSLANGNQQATQQSQGTQNQLDFFKGLGAGSAAPLNRKEQLAEEKLNLEKEKFTLQEYEKLEPFLKGQAEDFKNAKLLYKTAQEMRNNLLKNRKKFPGVIGANIVPEKFRTDKDVRKYIADANKLVLLQAGARKGQPTNFKVKLEQLTKPELSQPVETQLELLNNYISDAEEVFGTQKNMDRIRRENDGRYPRNLAQRLIEDQLPNVGSNDQPIQQSTVAQDIPESAMPQEGQSDDEGLLNAYFAGPLARVGANLVSSAAGLPALPAQLVGSIGNYLSGGALPTYEQIQEMAQQQPNPLSGQLLNQEQIMNQSAFPQVLPPTANQVRKSIDESTGGFTAQRGTGLGENIVAETALSLIPVLGPVRAASNINKLKTVLGTLGRVSAGNVAAFATENVGGGPIAQTAVKMGVMALAGTAGGRAALRDEMKKKYDAADIAAGNDTVNAENLSRAMNKMSENVIRGDKIGKEFIKERIEAVQKDIHRNKIAVADARELKRNMNAWAKDRSTPKEVKPYIEKIAGEIKGTLDDYKKVNPVFAENFNEAEKLFAALGGDLTLKDFVQKNPDTISKITNAGLKSALGLAISGGGAVLKGPLVGAGLGLGGTAAYHGYKFIHLLAKSPLARKYYKEVAAAALKNDKASFIKSAQKLDKVANSEE